MSNINGKVYALNVITPMKPWKTWILRTVFFVLGHVKPLQADLINLSFIEFARWVIIPRSAFPCLGKGQPQEELQYDYLLFFSNFNGTWNQYIDAFSAVLSKGLNLIWRWSEKFQVRFPSPCSRNTSRASSSTPTTTTPHIHMPRPTISSLLTSCSRRSTASVPWPSSPARNSSPMPISVLCCRSRLISARLAKLPSSDRETAYAQ